MKKKNLTKTDAFWTFEKNSTVTLGKKMKCFTWKCADIIVWFNTYITATVMYKWVVCYLWLETHEDTEDKKRSTLYQPALVCAQIAFLFQLKPCKHATGILKQNTVYNFQNLLWISILKLRNRSHLNEYSKLLYKATWNHIKLLSLVYHSS